MLWRGIEIDEHECMDKDCYDIECRGEVQMRYSQMGTPNPRCEAHQDRRDGVEQHIRELESPLPPDDFDESYAGEHWNEDY
jgi:hypothetical protein